MSKGLEALERIKPYLEIIDGEDGEIWATGEYEEEEALNTIEKELKEYEEMKTIKGTTTFDKAIEDTLINACPNVAKKLKALEIIKEKLSPLARFTFLPMTQEEFELVEEILK